MTHPNHDHTAGTPTSGTRGLRSLALTVSAAAAATALTVSLAGSIPSATADPGDTYVPTGSSRLVQSEDLQAIELPYDSAQVTLGRNQSFPSCRGKSTSWTSLLPGSATPVAGTWSQRGHSGKLRELIAQADDEAEARQWESTLVRSVLTACGGTKTSPQHGPVHHDSVGSGRATWAVLRTGTPAHAEGGVVVIRQGTSVGLVMAYGDWRSPTQTVESVAKISVDRLA
jgi:hypothetical protein